MLDVEARAGLWDDQPSPDEEEPARVEPVRPGQRGDRRPRRAAMPVSVSPGRTTCLCPAARRTVRGFAGFALRPVSRAARVRFPTTPSAGSLHPALELPDALLGRGAEVAVQVAERKAALGQQKLEHRDVEADHAALQHPGAEELSRSDRRPRGCACPRRRRARSPSSAGTSESLPWSGAPRSVDRAFVVAVAVRGDLDSGHLDLREGRGLAGGRRRRSPAR